MFPVEIETDRLRLVRLCRETIATKELYEYMRVGAPDMAEINEYVIWEPHRTIKDTYNYLNEIEEQWENRDQATYVVYPREHETDEGEFAGVTNLHIGWERRAAELGIWLRKPFWGRGYSGERTSALLELAFKQLDLELVGAAHQDGNVNSKRAIERYIEVHGGQYDGILRNWIPKKSEVRDLHRYTVSREQYREACK
ncbi:MAG: GNAT family N-acetyltransferase [Euryarchaeota archaeon]|nr:GNAT family N-acetyltransferase [Euryarchaeota archaeon]